MKGPAEKAFDQATSNPHPEGSMSAACWDFVRAVEVLIAPLWEWLIDRSPRQLVIAVVICFAALVGLSVVAGRWEPLAMGIVFWFAGGMLVGRRS